MTTLVTGWVFAGLHAYTLLWTADVPLQKLASVEGIRAMPEDKAVLRAAFGEEPCLLLTYSEPIGMTGLLGWQRQTTQIALYVDAPAQLQARLLLEPHTHA